MKIRSLLLISTMTLYNCSVFASAAEDRWNSMPEERKTRLIDRGAESGFDMTTEEGRREFRDSRREERAADAAQLSHPAQKIFIKQLIVHR